MKIEALALIALICICIASANAAEVVVTVKNAYTASSISSFIHPDEGYKYLVLDLEMVNNGYDKFSVNPNYLKLVLSNGHYSYDWSTFNIKDIGYPPMGATTIEDGETLDTAIAFQVPASSSSADTWGLRWQDWAGSNVRFVL